MNNKFTTLLQNKDIEIANITRTHLLNRLTFISTGYWTYGTDHPDSIAYDCNPRPFLYLPQRCPIENGGSFSALYYCYPSNSLSLPSSAHCAPQQIGFCHCPRILSFIPRATVHSGEGELPYQPYWVWLPNYQLSNLPNNPWVPTFWKPLTTKTHL